MSVPPHRAEMAAHVWILSEVTAVIALLDGLEQLARVNCQICTLFNNNNNK